MTMRAAGSVPSGEQRNASAASTPMPSAGIPAPPLRPLDPDTAPTFGSGYAIRNPTAPIRCASESLTRRCTCPLANGYSWRSMTMRPRTRSACRGSLETLHPAQAETEDVRHDARRRCRAQKRRAWERNTRHRAHQLRRAAPPTRIVDGVVANLCTRHGREPLPGEGQSRGFARRAGDAAAEIAQRLKVRPHQRVAGTYRRREQRPRRCRLSHGTLIPTDLTMSAQRAVSLSIKAWNCAGEAWDAVTPSGARRIANSRSEEHTSE